MLKNKIILAKNTLKLIEKKPWSKVVPETDLSISAYKDINSKIDLLKNINKFFDYELRKIHSLEDSSSKDRLFEVLMARFDILNTYRKPVKNLFTNFRSNPHQFLPLVPSFIETIILMSTLAGINVNGPKGAINIKSIFIIYILSAFTWVEDENESLEKTMMVLDKYISKADEIIKYK